MTTEIGSDPMWPGRNPELAFAGVAEAIQIERFWWKHSVSGNAYRDHHLTACLQKPTSSLESTKRRGILTPGVQIYLIISLK